MSKDRYIFGFISFGFVGVALISIATLFLWGCPTYNVWEQHMVGKAELSRAEYNRQVAVQEAIAKRDAAKSLAEAEIERAKGVAQANAIIGDSLKGNEDYLRYLWIDGIQHKEHSIIYVPTEAGLPILESGRAVSKVPVGNAAPKQLERPPDARPERHAAGPKAT